MRIPLLGVLAVALLSVTAAFFTTHAGEAVPESDVAVSRADLSATDLCGSVRKSVTRGGRAASRPMTAHPVQLSFTVAGSKLGFTVNAGSHTELYVDWGDGSFVRETSADGYFYNDHISGTNIRISGVSTIVSYICDPDDNCYIRSFDASGCPTLEELDLTNNMIPGTLDLSANQNLKKLNCSNNSLTCLKVSHKAVLTELDCSRNQLLFPRIDVPNGTRGIYSPQLTSFVFYNGSNGITSDIIYDKWMDELAPDVVSLKKPNGNTVSYTTDYKWYVNDTQQITSGFSQDAGKFKFSHSLLGKHVKCVMTNQHFKDKSGNLAELSVSAYVVPEAVSFTVTLDDSYNASTYSVDINDDAQYVFADSAKGEKREYSVRQASNAWAITSTQRRVIRYYAENVTSLTVTAGTIKALDISGLPDLQYLTVSGNPSLTALDLTGCTKLKEVHADGCALTSLVLPAAPSLTALDARGNKLKFSTVTQPEGFTAGDYRNQSDNTVTIDSPVRVGDAVDLTAEYVDARTVYTWTPAVTATVNAGAVTFGTDGIGRTTSAVITHPDYPGLRVPTTATTIEPADGVLTMTTSDSSGAFSFTLNQDAENVYVDYGSGFAAAGAGSNSGTLTGHTVRVYAENVTSLSVPSRNLTGLDVTRLASLQSLDISGNPALGMPDLSGNPSLTTLNCSRNDLTSLDVSGLTSLTALDARGNKLKFSTVTQPAGFTAGDYRDQSDNTVTMDSSVKVGDAVDLTAEYVDARTVYTWTPAVTATVNAGTVTFGEDARGKALTGEIRHPDYPGLTVPVAGLSVLPGFEVDDGGLGVIAEPSDDLELETEDGDPISPDEVILKIVRLNDAQLAEERQALTASDYAIGETDCMDGYEITLVTHSGKRVYVVGGAGIRITLPYGRLTPDGFTFVLYHHSAAVGLEVIPHDTRTQGLAFTGLDFSPYFFVATPIAQEQPGSPSGGSEGKPDPSQNANGSEGEPAASQNTNGSETPGTGESALPLATALLLLLLSAGAIGAVSPKNDLRRRFLWR